MRTRIRTPLTVWHVKECSLSCRDNQSHFLLFLRHSCILPLFLHIRISCRLSVWWYCRYISLAGAQRSSTHDQPRLDLNASLSGYRFSLQISRLKRDTSGPYVSASGILSTCVALQKFLVCLQFVSREFSGMSNHFFDNLRVKCVGVARAKRRESSLFGALHRGATILTL